MQLKNTLVGALIGGAIGVAVLIAAYYLIRADHAALAIVVALLVGFGVRAKVVTKGHASYLRGALTALVAIAAFVGGKFIVAEIAARQVVANSIQPAQKPAPLPKEASRVASDAAAESASESAAAESPFEPPAEVEVTRADDRTQTAFMPSPPPVRRTFSTWDFLWVCAAALVAYELGRGGGTASPIAPAAPAPAA